MTLSATPDENLGPHMLPVFETEVLWSRTSASRVADAAIGAHLSRNNTEGSAGKAEDVLKGTGQHGKVLKFSPLRADPLYC
jgi:hypothetical protein